MLTGEMDRQISTDSQTMLWHWIFGGRAFDDGYWSNIAQQRSVRSLRTIAWRHGWRSV